MGTNIFHSHNYVAYSSETGNKSATCDWSQIQYTPIVYAIMVSDIRLDKYFQFVKDMLLEEVY